MNAQKNSMTRFAPAARLFAVALVILTVASGCVAKRPKVIVDAPIDLTDSIKRDELQELLKDVDLQMTRTEEYYLGPGDIISVQLIGRPDVLGAPRSGYGMTSFGDSGQLGPSGVATDAAGGVLIQLTESPMISLPMVGAIQAHNKTAGQLQEDLRVAYGQFIKDPRPLVLVQYFSRNRVNVIGAVQRPGSYPFEFGDTIMDLVFQAGGLSMGGRTGGLAPAQYLRVYRMRINPEDRAKMTMEELVERLTTDDGNIVQRDEIVLPMREMIFGASLEYNIPVRPDDVIYIAPAGTSHVIGRVENPGVVFLGPSVSTLSQVLAERGGLKYSADSIVEVVRAYPDGQNVSYFMNARDMLGRRERDFVIQDGDQIVVYGTSLRTIGEFLGQMFRGSVSAGANATYNPVTGI